MHLKDRELLQLAKNNGRKFDLFFIFKILNENIIMVFPITLERLPQFLIMQ